MAGKGNGGQAGDAPAPAPASPPPGLGAGGAPVAVVVGVHEEVPPQEENAELPAHGAGLGGGLHLPVAVDVAVQEDVPEGPEEQHPAPAAHDAAADVDLLEALAPEHQENAPAAPDGDEDAGALNLHLQELEAQLDAPEPSDVTMQQLEGSSILREMELASGLPNPKKPRLDPPSGQTKMKVVPVDANRVPDVGGGSGSTVLMNADAGAGMGPVPQLPIFPGPPPLRPMVLCPAGCGRPAVKNTIGTSMVPPIVLPPHLCLCEPCYNGAPDRWDTDCAVCRNFYGAYPGKKRRSPSF
ncbi:uncharacterized protein LOC123429588 isoform X2 [Hordeum vulgare subsp. vulgare]|uniref:uncharacterized protein LOC123429588 isoform X2 n=1 Tax=Hordeum vulgare subsp. vulgare TaxID=112509 RepID=UPI001D1A5607|nr:uncharacterized protein LOC123429588 isoform X2 [Hordeum vulgare subsp. vulgare]